MGILISVDSSVPVSPSATISSYLKQRGRLPPLYHDRCAGVGIFLIHKRTCNCNRRAQKWASLHNYIISTNTFLISQLLTTVNNINLIITTVINLILITNIYLIYVYLDCFLQRVQQWTTDCT